MFCTASFLQGKLKVHVTLGYFYLCWTALIKTIAICIKALAATLSPRTIDKLNTLILQLVQNGYITVVLMVWLLFSFVHSFPFTWFFAVAILRYAISILFLGGVALLWPIEVRV